MDSDVSKILAMVNGRDRNDTDSVNITDQDQEKIYDAIESIFLGKSILLWVQGGKLVDAWTHALDDVRQELFAIPNKCPAVQYLRIAVFNHHNAWSRKMMASNERNSVAQIQDKQEYDKLVNHANTLIQVGETTISEMIKKYSAAPVGRAPEKQFNTQLVMANEMERKQERVRKM